MRALTVLFAVLLLALQTPAEPLRERAAELPSQEQPEAQDQDMANSFAGDKSAIQEAAGERPGVPQTRHQSISPQQRKMCYCRTVDCLSDERQEGSCTIYRPVRKLCCR